ncbi:hypothetical protein ABFS83_01G075300 [Erythranthe nasuta]
MQILNQILTPCAFPLISSCSLYKTLAFSRTRLGLNTKRRWIAGGSLLFVDSRKTLCHWGKKEKMAVVSASGEGNLGTGVQKKRKVIEHICLVKAKEDLSEEQENDMLDYLYTTQYQMRGIIAISLGRLSENPEQYTHAIFMRFQTKEDLAKFYENPFYMRVLEEHVNPYCHGFVNFDYESEVEDDILAIFRKGEEFNYGVELVLLLQFNESSLDGPTEDAMASLANLTMEFPSLIVQATKGPIVNTGSSEYTHGVVIRFRSSEAFKMFMSSSEYNTIWKSKVEPIVQKALSVHFRVDPVGKELM